MAQAPVQTMQILGLRDGVERTVADQLIVEEPLEIRVGDEPVAVVMRTPGDDMALAVGFLFSEGILRDPDQVLSVAYCMDTQPGAEANIVRVLADGADADALAAARRDVFASSSCGLCGKTTLDAVRLLLPALPPRPSLTAAVAAGLPEALRAGQALFASTGAAHAAGLFTPGGEFVLLREDVGRHNAVDKVLGSMVLREVWPLADRVLALSGRASFEMVQKAAMAGIGAIVAVSAPTSLAVELAREHGMLLVGFLRGGSMNVYSGQLSGGEP